MRGRWTVRQEGRRKSGGYSVKQVECVKLKVIAWDGGSGSEKEQYF